MMHMTCTVCRKGPALQQHVVECLIEMLKEKPYQAITISDLCKRAGIARKSFYRYYPTKDICFQSVAEHVIILVMTDTYASMTGTSTTSDFYFHYLNSWKKHKWFLNVVRRNDLDFLLIQKGMALIQSVDAHLVRLLETREFVQDLDILRCYVTCDFLLILEWSARGFDASVEEMARKYVRLLHHPFIPLSESEKMWLVST